METLRNWSLPLAVVAAEALLWPGAGLRTGRTVSGTDLAVALVAGAVATAALGLRRRAPLVALGGVAAASELAWLVVPLDAVALYGAVGEAVAVYSVAARTTVPVTLRAVGVLLCAETLVSLVADGVALVHRLDQLVSLVVWLVCAGLGRGRARWRASRAEAAERPAHAQTELEGAAAGERRRLARELHDVSAHRLTSVIVTADAARHLAAKRPELTSQALDFAARTGRETLDTLHRLAATLRTAEENGEVPLMERIEGLAAGFVRLGQPVEVEVDVDEGVAVVGGAVAEAVFGIAREALTNALRYAPGAAVRVAVRDLGDGRLALVVDNDRADGETVRGGDEDGDGGGLGSGRGMTGMRERAASVGGTATAGPRPGPAGGWSVRAELPVRPGRVSTTASGDTDRRFAEQAALFGALAVPAALLFAQPRSAGTRLLLGVLLLVQTLPLLGRRRAPWPVLGAVLAVTSAWLWVPRSVDATWVVVASGCALLVGVYAVAAYGTDARVSWPSAPLAAVVLGVAGTAAAQDGLFQDGTAQELPRAVEFGIAAFALALVVLPPLGGVWLAGVAVRSRRARVRRGEERELDALVHGAVAAAHAERQRVAAGLRTDVLDRTADMVRVAEEGRLDDVSPAAREALAAMRELLGRLRDGTLADDPRAPQPTAADLPRLCRDRRVVLHAAADLPELPDHVGLMAYRLVETALTTGSSNSSDTADDFQGAQVLPYRPEVRLDRAPGGLTLTLSGVPHTTADRLRPRATAAGGRLIPEGPVHTVQIWLPVSAPAP